MEEERRGRVMKRAIKCTNCSSSIRDKKYVVTHPTEQDSFSFTCSDKCARALIEKYIVQSDAADYCVLKIYTNRGELFNKIKQTIDLKELINERHKKDPISDEEVLDFKINFGLNSNDMIEKMIFEGEGLMEKNVEENNTGPE